MSIESKSKKARIAAIDDEPVLLEAWQELLSKVYDVTLLGSAAAAEKAFAEQDFDLALTDLRMPGVQDLDLLEKLIRLRPETQFIVVSGHGTIDLAVRALRLGAYDFLQKPLDNLDSVLARIGRALELRRLRETNKRLQSRLEAHGPSSTLVGESRALVQVKKLIAQVADSSVPVLIQGESGTGKELVARAIMAASKRKDKPFVAVNCGAISEALIDSELFGHERGAFTGAVTSHAGLFAAANGGTLFLDELGEMPLATQVRLLRVLQEGEIRHVGSTKSKSIDVRVLCATHVDLEKAMRAGKFREDLFYRVSTFRLELPPLRERKEDIPLIAQSLLERAATRDNKPVRGFTDAALETLLGYEWPGNVRELGNAIEYALVLAQGELLTPEDLPSRVLTGARGRSAPRKAAPSDTSAASPDLERPYSEQRTQLLDDFERRYLTTLIESAGGNLSEAARRSGIDRSNLRRMLKRYELEPERLRVLESVE